MRRVGQGVGVPKCTYVLVQKNFVIYVRKSESLVMMFQIKFCIHNEKAFALIVHVGE